MPGAYIKVGHESWNRYYDPSIGRYLQPEPLQQSHRYLAAMVRGGHSVPAYAYAANNPIYWLDVTGLDVTNSKDASGPAWAKDEDSAQLYEVRPGTTWKGKQDGVVHPDVPGKVYKTINGVDVTCTKGGEVEPSSDSLARDLAQAVRGGWKPPGFTEDGEWNPLFEKAGVKDASSRWVPPERGGPGRRW